MTTISPPEQPCLSQSLRDSAEAHDLFEQGTDEPVVDRRILGEIKVTDQNDDSAALVGQNLNLNQYPSIKEINRDIALPTKKTSSCCTA